MTINLTECRRLLELRGLATKGPWVSEHGTNRSRIFTPQRTRSSINVDFGVGPAIKPYGNEEMARADANLIASAHDLADQLAAALEIIETLAGQLRFKVENNIQMSMVEKSMLAKIQEAEKP